MRCPFASGSDRRCATDGGAIVVELALAALVLFLVVFGVIDLGRAYSLQNRLTNAAREGGAAAQFRPTYVDTGCNSGNNIVDRASGEDSGLASISGFAVTVAKQSGGTTTAYSGCGTPTGGVTVSSGDTVVVTTKANFSVITPLIGAMVGNTIVVTKTISVVVQGRSAERATWVHSSSKRRSCSRSSSRSSSP
jgi:Flp pilus assembly protein TadG